MSKGDQSGRLDHSLAKICRLLLQATSCRPEQSVDFAMYEEHPLCEMRIGDHSFTFDFEEACDLIVILLGILSPNNSIADILNSIRSNHDFSEAIWFIEYLISEMSLLENMGAYRYGFH